MQNFKFPRKNFSEKKICTKISAQKNLHEIFSTKILRKKIRANSSAEFSAIKILHKKNQLEKNPRKFVRGIFSKKKSPLSERKFYDAKLNVELEK
jgi:hypothetical protein